MVFSGKVVVQLPDMRGNYSDEGIQVWREEYPTYEEAEAFVMHWRTFNRIDMSGPMVIESDIFDVGD
jgi:hypothetical protein